MPIKNNQYGKISVFFLILIMAVILVASVKTSCAEEGTLVSTDKVVTDAAGKTDPFKPFVDKGTEAVKKTQAKNALPISPLQRQDLAAFSLVGIVGNDKEGWKAIVEDGEKKFYPIVEGTLIGLNQGRVTSIKSDRVIVAVKADDKKGKTSYITIMLHKDVEETP